MGRNMIPVGPVWQQRAHLPALPLYPTTNCIPRPRELAGGDLIDFAHLFGEIDSGLQSASIHPLVVGFRGETRSCRSTAITG